MRQRLPDRRNSEVYGFVCEGRMYHATISRFDDGRLAEIFLNTDKPSSALQINAENAAILTSLALQHGVPADTILHSINGPIAEAIKLARSA